MVYDPCPCGSGEPAILSLVLDAKVCVRCLRDSALAQANAADGVRQHAAPAPRLRKGSRVERLDDGRTGTVTGRNFDGRLIVDWDSGGGNILAAEQLKRI